jgi:hypothetical protein
VSARTYECASPRTIGVQVINVGAHLDGVDDLVQEEGRVGDVARYPVKLLLLPQVETLTHRFLADDARLVLKVSIICMN